MTIAIDLVFDGIGRGVYGRLAQKMAVRYSGKRSADDTILDLVSEQAMQGAGPVAAAKVLVVTNDRALRDRIAAKGARTVPLQWLIARLDIPAPAPRPATGPAATGSRGRPPSIGQGRPPAGQGQAGGRGPGGKDETDRPGWKPGRGATSKTGVARKVARHKRHPRAGG